MFGKLLLPLLLVANALFAANHVDYFHLSFAQGRYTVNQNVQTQIAKMFKLMPEQSFTRLHMEGENEGAFLANIKYLLAKRRTEGVAKFLVDAGLKPDYVKVNYANIPNLLVFKEKTKRVVDEIARVADVEKKCACERLNAAVSNTIVTQKGNFISIPPEAFQSEIGIPITKGFVTFCYNEIDLMESVDLGWHHLKDGAIWKDFYDVYFKVDFNDQPLQLRDFSKITINRRYTDTDLNSGYFASQSGSFKNSTWLWENEGEIPFFMAEQSPVLERYSGNVIRHGSQKSDDASYRIFELNSLGYNRVRYHFSELSSSEKDVMYNTPDKTLVIRAIYPENEIVLPVYRDNNFNNLFHCRMPDIDESGVLVVNDALSPGCWLNSSYTIARLMNNRPLLMVQDFSEMTCWNIHD